MTAFGVLPLYVPRLCPDCGHATWRHRETSAVNARKPDDPVPCAAVVSSRVVRTRPNGQSDYEYEFCGCTTVHRLSEEHRG